MMNTLQWLQAHNPLYANVDIHQDHLDIYLEDNVPSILQDLIRMSDNVSQLLKEHNGYVPEDCVEQISCASGVVGITETLMWRKDMSLGKKIGKDIHYNMF
ncbi:hypothetical protein DXG01_006174 [Tephrocybe rancida]|nr:hypothetical protein DXG01_006174 [Tephrocybe rancida]